MSPKNAADFTEDELRRIEARWKSDVDLKLDRMDARLHVIERLVWVAVGGTTIIAAIVSFGVGIVQRQADQLSEVALRQAAAIAERRANEQAMKAEIERLRGLLK